MLLDPIDGTSPTAQALDTTQNGKLIPRQTPQIAPAREALVKRWADRVRQDKAHWKPSFDRMRRDMKFAAGKQWPDQQPNDDRYVANIVLRHLKHRTASLYAKNPRTVCKRREQILSTVWDGSQAQLQQALMSVQAAQQAAADPAAVVADPRAAGALAADAMNGEAILQDAMAVAERVKLLDRVGKTLELVYTYSLDEQSIPFKLGMKEVVRRALTTGVGYAKLGFQRAMQRKPETERSIADFAERLALIERLSSDIADGQNAPDSPEAEQLRAAIAALEAEPMMIVREGLDVSYPDSTAIIPAKSCTRLRGFVGAPWATEEYLLSADDIQEIYGVDVRSSGANKYVRGDNPTQDTRWFEPWSDKEGCEQYCVWEIYSRKDGLVYVVCDGYPDFLREPAAPDVYMERFYPWFALCFNEVYDPEHVYPPSDVSLIRDMQLETNRARQGLREHRRANRPKVVTAAGMLDEQDKDKLRNHPANALIELNALQPGQAVDQVLQPLKMPTIDPTLYDVSGAFEDILRVVGSQEANLGGTSGASATESSIAEGSRLTGQGSDVDDLDEMLTEMARAAGQILLLNLTEETAKEIAGPGAVWPVLDKASVAKEIYLEIEAASTGRPNEAAEMQKVQQAAPIVMQLPGINPEWFAKQVLTRMDARIDLAEAFAEGLPSIQAMNRAAQVTAAAPGKDPEEQGEEGADNEKTEPGRPVDSTAPEAPPPMPQVA